MGKKRKLNYRFHDPNPPDKAADYIARLFVEVNSGKVEQVIREAASAAPEAGQQPKE